MQDLSTSSNSLITRVGTKTTRSILPALVLFLAALAYMVLSPQSHVSPIGQPATTGWLLLDENKNRDGISIRVHHVIATNKGVYVIYSAKANALGGRLTLDVAARSVLDGTIREDSASDHLVATDDVTAIRIASLGKPVPGTTNYGMNLSGLDTEDTAASISLNIIADETPGVVEDDISFMSHPSSHVAPLLNGAYSVVGPQGITFGILPQSIIAVAESAPSYFMIAPGGTIREITFEELVAFNERHTR